MATYETRLKDIIKIISTLDITPTMYKNATEKYKSLAEFLQNSGIEAAIFPQGSFATGTVVKPLITAQDPLYDLDFICKLNETQQTTTAKEIKHKIGDILKQSDRYSDKLEEEWNRCWTLEYAEINDVGFKMDIVPAIDLDNSIPVSFTGTNTHDFIMITDRKDQTYEWIISNPKGYINWFNGINAPYLEVIKEQQRTELYKSNRSIYASVEEVPPQLYRSNVQRAIQILKRHRDVYFENANSSQHKPGSIILATLLAKMAEININKSIDLFDFLKLSINDIRKSTETMKNNNLYVLNNPVNPNENLIAEWNEDPQKVNKFLSWIKNIQVDLLDPMFQDDKIFMKGLSASFGVDLVEKNIDQTNYFYQQPSVLTHTAKPWRGKK